MNPNRKGISVIICVFNGETRLPETLRCLAKQEKTEDFNVEIILIDNASTDKTTKIAKKIWAETGSKTEFKILSEPAPGKSNALVTGFNNAQYEYLLICDDDNRLFPDYLSTAFKIMENHPEVGVLGGQGIPDFESTPPFWFEKFKQYFAIGKQLPESGILPDDSYSVYGAGAILRSKIWLQLKQVNFHFLLTCMRGKVSVGGEDTELFEMVKMFGYKIMINNNMRFYHYLPSGRLIWDNFVKFVNSLGRSNIYIYVYVHCRKNDDSPLEKTKMAYWLDKYIYTLKSMKKFVPVILKSLFSGMEGDENYILYQGYRGRLYELRKLKGKYDDLFEIISTYKKNNNDPVQDAITI